MRDFGGAVPAGPAISHAIPSNVFHDLKSDRWNSADYGVMLRRGDVELHAKLRDGTRLRDDACSSGALHCLRGHCTAWLLVQWCATWCIACLFGATRCQETAVTFAARSSWWRFHLGAKSSPCAAVLSEFYRARGSAWGVLGEFCRGMGPAWRSCLLEGLMLSEPPLALQGLASG